MSRLILLIALLFTTAPLHAQEMGELMRFLRSPMGNESAIGNHLAFSRARWNGNGAYMGVHAYLLNTDAKAELELSEEQFERLNAICRESAVMTEKREQQDPMYMNAIAEVQKTALPDDPHFENANAEQLQAHSQALQKLVETNLSQMHEELKNVLTPEQMQIIHIRDLQLSAEQGLPTTSMYEALGLSDQQRSELDAVRKALEPEFEKLLQEDAAFTKELYQFAINDLMKKHNEKPFESPEEIDKYFEENENKRLDDEMLKKIEQMQKRGQDFTKRLKVKMLDVLTDEQIAQIEKLLKNPSSFVQKELQELRAARLEREKSGQWKPGPDSWKPGDPLPEEYLQKRRESRFPKK